jgi:peptide-methionine (S)-S-oxide reductase
MANYFRYSLLVIIAFAAACNIVNSSGPNADVVETIPAAALETEAEPQGMQTTVFAGGCFWGVEAVFEHVKGVKDVKSGYAGGDARSAKYDLVSEGRTDHAESVRVIYDPTKVSFEQLLNVFFTVAHDPTQLNRQGPDVGRHYRSAIFYATEEQRGAAAAYIEELGNSGKYQNPIVTEIVPLKKFYNAESYHQDFMRKNPDQPYIVQHDKPKIEDLKNKFPDLFVDKKYVKFGR